ncbi:unnamed protein product [Durusdinium trenchii]|uniref:Uncharacterized protein n=2 Tax=Durusdinium trenchii TaxID=1381693 RepID=A0ABP0N8L7_9DINO
MTGPSPAVLRKVAETSDVDTLKVLLAGTDASDLLSQVDSAGQSALHLAVRAVPTDEVAATVSTLIASRARLEQANARGETPLILAVRTALAAAVPDGPWLLPIQLILEAKARACAADRQGRSSLSYAASAGSLSICRMLLTFRADPTQANSFGATPQSLAERQGHAEVTKLLAEVASTASKPAKKASDEAKGAKTAKWQTKKEEQGSQERQGAKVHPTGQIPEWRQSDEQTKEVKRLVQKWSSASFQQLMQECKMQRINTQDASHEELCQRLLQLHAWERMSDEELKQSCFSRGVPFPKSCFTSAYSVNREADRCDVIFRLKEAVFGLRPGEFGPLPVAPADAASQVGQAADTPSAARPKAKPAAKATSPKAENQAGKPSDDSWKSDARMERLLKEFPSFSGPAPGPDSVHWNDAELRQYFFSNGYLRPRSSRTATNTSAAPRELLRHFETLGLHPTASPEEVRRAYRGLALKHHPDKKADSSSTDFQRIQEAYDALSSRRV